MAVSIHPSGTIQLVSLTDSFGHCVYYDARHVYVHVTGNTEEELDAVTFEGDRYAITLSGTMANNKKSWSGIVRHDNAFCASGSGWEGLIRARYRDNDGNIQSHKTRKVKLIIDPSG